MYAADYRLMIRHDSGMAEPIEKAAKEKGMKPTDFIKSVLKEYLISHRYMTDAPNSEE